MKTREELLTITRSYGLACDYQTDAELTQMVADLDSYGKDAEPVFYESPALKIGKNEWRIVVFRHRYYGRCTRYEFSGPAARFPGWNNADTFPGYAGRRQEKAWPKTSAKVYYDNAIEINKALGLRGRKTI